MTGADRQRAGRWAKWREMTEAEICPLKKGHQGTSKNENMFVESCWRLNW